jgi:hypothetical protein
VLVPVIVTRWPLSTGTTAVILLIVVPVSPPAVLAYFQVSPTATGNGTDAPEPPAAAAGELAETAALAEAVAVALAEAAADVVAGAVVAPVPAGFDEPDEPPDEAQPASASTAANRQPAVMAAVVAAGCLVPGDRRLMDV